MYYTCIHIPPILVCMHAFEVGSGTVPVAEDGMELYDEVLLVGGEGPSLDVRPQIVCPPQPVALPAPHQPYTTPHPLFPSFPTLSLFRSFIHSFIPTSYMHMYP